MVDYQLEGEVNPVFPKLPLIIMFTTATENQLRHRLTEIPRRGRPTPQPPAEQTGSWTLRLPVAKIAFYCWDGP